VGCLVTALRKGGKHALTGSASGTNSVILKNLYFLTRNDPFFHAVLWGRGHPDPRTLKLLERPFFAPCYGGGHHPDPRPKHPDPRLWLGFLTQFNRRLSALLVVLQPDGWKLPLHAHPHPQPEHQQQTLPHSTARADTQDKLKLFAGVWRGRQPVLCLEQCARTHALWTAVSARAMQGDCVSVVKGLRARLKQDALYLLQTRCVEHMTHEQQCQHTVCRKTNCPSGSLSALSAAELPDLVDPPW
jgi:hypothetical protein